MAKLNIIAPMIYDTEGLSEFFRSNLRTEDSISDHVSRYLFDTLFIESLGLTIRLPNQTGMPGVVDGLVDRNFRGDIPVYFLKSAEK
jgi:hypothetical protein